MRVLVAKIATLTIAAAGIFVTAAPASAGERESESAHTNKSAADDHAHSHKTWHVSPGTGTISAAVAAAKAGDTLLLKAGTFVDSVTIDKTLIIRGKGWSKTIIKPPANPSPTCFQNALCVFGVVDSKFTPDLTKPVKNVSISRLRLTGFLNGVFALNSMGLKVHDVRADDNSEYGIAAFSSTRSKITDNWTSGSGEAGVYLGDSPNAGSLVEDNRADDNALGIFLRDSSGITVKENKSWGNCIGILALSTHAPAPGEPLAGNFKIRDNKVWANNKVCAAVPEDEIPAFSGIGIALAGVDGVIAQGNKVTNHNGLPANSDLPQGGIVVFSTVMFGGTNPTNNTVTKNKVRNNTPFDILWDGTGTGNKVSKNKCETASPSNLGWCSE